MAPGSQVVRGRGRGRGRPARNVRVPSVGGNSVDQDMAESRSPQAPRVPVAENLPTVVEDLQAQVTGIRTVLDRVLERLEAENLPQHREAEISRSVSTEEIEQR